MSASSSPLLPSFAQFSPLRQRNGSSDDEDDVEGGKEGRSLNEKPMKYFPDLLDYKPRWATLPTNVWSIRYMLAIIAILVVSFVVMTFYTLNLIPSQISNLISPVTHNDTAWVKPAGFRIVGIVFCKSITADCRLSGRLVITILIMIDGRPRYVNILDCYLKKNLVSQGGYLDQIIFADNTNSQEDEDYLDRLIENEPGYSKVVMSHRGGWYDDVWNNLAIDENTLYFKIDDDVVCISACSLTVTDCLDLCS